ncbi:hybrid sensor histidine kinase/response regulator [Pseudomonas sp. 25 R 14]|uniref:hybrid sensor histidine kinase/response regulator n=1 Tax=Pseudomonas sp. 25 R 14 TaxID=1844109 RepID=UPI0008122157|nr:hybrid sensor histidine kinase/response regulator [Pseudomonas sp. 25 R 14]CRM68071.1 Sensor kinase protein RcsC [Pseudomonas sp. 25 R 14]CRM70809.1 Sensor kinase protein RcsC [Pseudomonas sp. 25 R 14]
MNQPNAFLEKLASSSLRLNKGLMVLGALVLVLAGISYVGVQRMIGEQSDTTRFHFARLMENIAEQQAFLATVSQQSAQGDLLPPLTSAQPTPRALPEQGPNIYEGREFSYSLPYSVKLNPARIAPSQRTKVFDLAAHLTAFYSAFWSASHYQSPQVLLFNGPDNFDISVPSAGALRDAGQIQGGAFANVVHRVETSLHENPRQPPDNQVHWKAFGDASSSAVTPTLLAYIHIDLAPTSLHIQGASSHVLVASLLAPSQVNNIERLMQWSIYDHFTLIAPSGEVLAGAQNAGKVLENGVNFTRDGLVFKLTSPDAQPWTAIYVIGFKSFLSYALWPLLCLAVLILAGLGGGRAFNRWYKNHVILPAHQAHASIAESEAFSRAVIDTAPAGLCVIRRSDHHVLLENQRARQWQGTPKLINALCQHCNLSESGQADLEIDGRHLQVAFINTRYQGQDAWLCAFHDVTRHIEDAIALEDARLAADSANEAKTRFLATMSHEIRTPLYGVLGTLELLGLTPLQPRQQDYLHTIQRSSATLFQLISDVLDVSKIESGQMTLEAQDFCPLELTEDTVRTYSAFARAKGLQLYACIDATVPDRVRGDPLRIRQILNNLLSNAIKFTDHGRVVLRLRSLDANRARLQWQVSDSGVGISQAQQVQLFDPFYQVHGTGHQTGAGLGLAICKWLCELMAGSLTVVSEPGLGSSFTLQLDLEPVAGTLADCPEFAPQAPAIYVRAPVPELAQHLCAWLNRLGVEASPQLPPALSSAVWVDVLPSAKDAPWPGSRVIASADGPNPPAYAGGAWQVDAYDVRAIAWAVCLAQAGSTGPSRPAQPEHTQRLNLKVLVAEDNPINSAIIKEQLEALGCSVVTAVNGEQALVQWRPGQFDLVLTDVNMPLMNGYELAQALRQQDADIPIIGVTANALREEGEHCAAVGMNAWMVKPLSLSTLRKQLLLHCKANVAEPGIVVMDQVQLSPKMRELFASTLQVDIQGVRAALERADANAVAQQLHSMAGALGAVRAENLATAFVDLECRLMGLSVTPALAQEVRGQLERLEALINTLG